MYQCGTTTATALGTDQVITETATGAEIEVTDVSHRTRSRLALVLAMAAAGTVGATTILRSNNSPGAISTSVAAFASSEVAVSGGMLEITNEYGAQPMSIQSGYYAWDAIVEPLKTTTLEYSSGDDHDVGSNDSDEYKWKVFLSAEKSDDMLSTVDDEVETLEMEWTAGSNTTYTFTAAGSFYFIKVLNATDDAWLHSEEVICKYVRREMRTLSDEDRERHLAAMHTHYTVDWHEGRALYGTDYVPSTWLTRWHLGTSMNSPYHGTPAFFTSHAYFGAIVELSLQSIEPTTALHYWDFTNNIADSGEWYESFIFSKDWFGPHTSNSSSDTNKRVGGHWHNVSIMRNCSTSTGHGSADVTRNSYCLWTPYGNNNPSQYLTRSSAICGMSTKHMKLPGCMELLGTFNQTNMTNFHTYTELYLHLDLHIMIGGAWDCTEHLEEWFENKPHRLSEFNSTIESIVISSPAVWWTKYDEGDILCPDYCGLEVPFSECQCVSKRTLAESIEAFGGEEKMDVDDWYSLFMKDVSELLDQGIAGVHRLSEALSVDSEGRYFFTELGSYQQSEGVFEVGTRIYERPGQVSPFGSPLGSAVDPIFWSIHSNFEKNWQYMRLAKGLSSDYSHYSECTFTENGTTIPSDECLIGWNYDDPLMPMDEIYGVKRLPLGTYYTNREIAALVHPNRQEQPFIYDDFGYNHCQ